MAQAGIDGVHALRRMVPFGEYEIQHVEYRDESVRQHLGGRHVEADSLLAKTRFGSNDPLSDRSLIADECGCDLTRGEPECHVEDQRNLRGAWQRGVATQKHQPDLVFTVPAR